MRKWKDVFFGAALLWGLQCLYHDRKMYASLVKKTRQALVRHTLLDFKGVEEEIDRHLFI